MLKYKFELPAMTDDVSISRHDLFSFVLDEKELLLCQQVGVSRTSLVRIGYRRWE